MIMRLQSSCNNRSFFLAMVAATSACLRSHVGMYLCSYFQAAFGKTSQGVDPEDNDFQVPRLLCVGPFLGSLGRPFFLSRCSSFFCFFARFWVPFLVPFLVPKTGPRNRVLIGSFVVGPKLSPIFGSIFGTHFWAPDFEFFRIFFGTPAFFFPAP